MAVEVSITADIEFDINGAFANPDGRRPAGVESVRCIVGGQDYGLGFLLDTLEQFAIRGVFFVEAMNTAYFGDELMRSVAREIESRGHDVQLHLHPVWTVFDDDTWPDQARKGGIRPLTHDSFSAFEVDKARAFIRRGKETFARWGITPPVAVRTGNLFVGENFYAAMALEEMPISSSVGCAYFRPAEPALQLYSGIHHIGTVTEIPITTFADAPLFGDKHLSLATIIGCGSRQLVSMLESAARTSVSPIIFLTHVAEFIRHDKRSGGYENIRPRGHTRKKLQYLCRFLDGHRSDFEVVTFAERASAWSAAGTSGNVLLRTPTFTLLQRMLEERCNP